MSIVIPEGFVVLIFILPVLDKLSIPNEPSSFETKVRFFSFGIRYNPRKTGSLVSSIAIILTLSDKSFVDSIPKA